MSEYARLQVEKEAVVGGASQALAGSVGGFMGAMLVAVFVLLVSGVIAALVGRV